eukprot:COSAG06_NODE_39373_length_413_cov_0.990446_2_plen_79_part_01
MADQLREPEAVPPVRQPTLTPARPKAQTPPGRPNAQKRQQLSQEDLQYDGGSRMVAPLPRKASSDSLDMDSTSVDVSES